MAGLILPAIVVANNNTAKWEEYRRVLNLTSPVPGTASHLPDIFSFGVIDGGKYIVLDSSPPYLANCRLVLIVANLYDVYNTTKGSHHTLRFKMQRNSQYRYARLTVVQFSATGHIRKYYPRLADYELITPDSPCEFEISRHMYKPAGQATTSPRETSSFKAFITLAPVSFDTVEESRIRSDATTGIRPPEVGANHLIPALPEIGVNEWEAFRDAPMVPDELNPPARWRTMSVTIHTTS